MLMRFKFEKACRYIVSLAALPLLSSCNDAAQDPETTGPAAALSSAPSLHRIGAIPETEATMSAFRVASPALVGPLPSSVDLSAELPPVGDQGVEGSCVGWAVAYSAKTLQEVVENHWPPDDVTHEFSPSWIYNQINGGHDDGSNISTALGLVVSSGVDTMSNFPYVNGDYLTQPNANSMSRGAHFKAASWTTLGVTTTNFKNVIAGGNAVIVGFQVLPDMDAMNGTTNTVYDTDVGSRTGYTISPCPSDCTSICNGVGACGTCNVTTNVCTVPTCSTNCTRGGHAVALIGYDDTVGAFKFINQWGSGWNGNGYGWLAYSFITDADLGLQAFVMTDATDVPGVQDSTAMWNESYLSGTD